MVRFIGLNSVVLLAWNSNSFTILKKQTPNRELVRNRKQHTSMAPSSSRRVPTQCENRKG